MRTGAAILVVAAALCAASSASAQPLATGLFDPAWSDLGTVGCNALKATGASVVRVPVAWREVAPGTPSPSFNARDAADPGYRWDGTDARLQGVVACGFEPIVDLVGAPAWAIVKGTRDPGTPVASALGDFAAAAAARYSGEDPSLPRVRLWQVWNEPNLATQLSPQLEDGRPVGALAYRAMVNAVAAAVKGVASGNVVVAGGLAPFRDISPDTYRQDTDWGPLSFMRAFFCLSKSLKSTCATKARFDVWSHHPYTSGGPTHSAVLPDDVSLGDLPQLRRVLAAAVRAGHVSPRRMPRLWVTEFSWDSKPPDPLGVPAGLLQRWVPQALYEMWRNGVSLVTWFSLRDEPLATGFYQSGLLYNGGRKKPFFEGFRFPVVAFPRSRGFYVWGRTPAGDRSPVVIEQKTGGGWRRVARLGTGSSGIFAATLRAPRSGSVRARLPDGERSLAFSLRAVPDRFFNPFGNPTLLKPKP
jgi:hypothetical protein